MFIIPTNQEESCKTEVVQRGFESLNDKVDKREVSDLVKWLDTQTHIRRLTQFTTAGSGENSYKGSTRTGTMLDKHRRDGGNSVMNNSEDLSKCYVCQGNHTKLIECTVFPIPSFNEKWTIVKFLNVCFICLLPGHQRNDCTAPRCDRPQHTLLHNPRRLPGQTDQLLNTDAAAYSTGAAGIRQINDVTLHQASDMK